MFQHLFDELYNSQHTSSSHHIQDTKEAWVIEVDMPGVAKDKVEVNVLGRSLEVKGHRQKGEGTYTYRERFRLPDTLRNPEGVVASMDLGVLTVKVPKQGSGVLQIPIT